MFLLLILLLIYLLMVGFLTVLESKLLGMLQNSISVFKLSFFGLYHFYLDFLKVFMKFIFESESKKMSFYFVYLLMMLLLVCLEYLTLVFGFLFKLFFMHTIIMYMVFNMGILILKMLLLDSFSINYMKLMKSSISIVYIFMEGIFTYMCFFVMFFLVINFLKPISNILIMGLLILIFIFTIFKLFSGVADYFEMESELVGGGVLEMKSVGFLLWSLLEYGMIFNNILFLVYMSSLLLNFNIIFKILLLFILITKVFMISGLLISGSFNSLIYFLILMFFLINFLIFLVFLMF